MSVPCLLLETMNPLTLHYKYNLPDLNTSNIILCKTFHKYGEYMISDKDKDKILTCLKNNVKVCSVQLKVMYCAYTMMN